MMNYKENIGLLKMAKQRICGKYSGLCCDFYYMRQYDIINEREYCILNDLIKKNKPKTTYSMDSVKCKYYFEPFKAEQRIEYLDHLILLNNPNFFIRLYYKFKFRKIYSI